MYSKMAISAALRVCQEYRQISSALMVLKKGSIAALSWQLPFAAHPLPGNACLHAREGTP